ncbi:MAG: LemA family protein [Gammaproteobacteria bacterium]
MSVLIIVLPLLVWGVFLFNRLVQDRNRVRAAWSDIDVQLTRRHELVPRLVEAVKAYAGHERATLSAITELRSQSETARHLADKAEAEEQLTAGVQKLIALAEAYPDLKANQNFLDLQRELVDIEDFLQYARRFYNGAVRILSTRIETVPDNLIANLFGFEHAEYFVAEHRDAPQVSL